MGWTIDQIIALITLLFPLIEKVIEMVERIFKKSASAEKKAIAVKTLRATLPVHPATEVLTDEVLGKMVDYQVYLKNISKKFKHTNPNKTDLEPPSIFGA